MKNSVLEDVLRPLRVARWQLGMQCFLEALVKGALAASAGLVIYAALNRWIFDRRPLDTRVLIVAGVLSILFAAMAAVVRRRTLAQTAAILDRLGGTRDRFVTALDFSTGERAAPEMHQLALAECERYLGAGNYGRLLKVRLPSLAAWLLVPVATLILLEWEAHETFAIRAAEAAAARAAVEDTARKIEKLARETASAAQKDQDEMLRQLAEKLQRGADQLRAEARKPEDAEKTALGEISALEQMAHDLQKSPAGLTPEEQTALAKALAQNEATRDAAASLAAADPAKAAEQLEKEMRKLDDAKDERTSDEVRKSIEKAIEELKQQKQLSEAMQKLAQQLKQSQAQQGGGNSSEAAKALAQMLRQMAQGKSGQQSSGSRGEQSLQNLLAALQNMKAGEDQAKQGEGAPLNSPSAAIAMQSFSHGNPDAPTGPGDPRLPSGHPGGERDEGTTDSPFGAGKNELGQNNRREQVSGRLGEGDSLEQSLLSAGDNSKSHRAYKNLYEAMAPAAQDAVLQEDIPVGSRFFIRRYFEAIRPKE